MRILTQKVGDKSNVVENEVNRGSSDAEEVTLPGLPMVPHSRVLELEYRLKSGEFRVIHWCIY